jgi:hypothetical protein
LQFGRDVGDSIAAESVEVIEVETEAPRLHERAGLASVITETVAQDPVQHMCGGVSLLGAQSPRAIDLGIDLVSHGELAAHDAHSVTRQSREKSLGIDDLGDPR